MIGISGKWKLIQKMKIQNQQTKQQITTATTQKRQIKMVGIGK